MHKSVNCQQTDGVALHHCIRTPAAAPKSPGQQEASPVLIPALPWSWTGQVQQLIQPSTAQYRSSEGESSPIHHRLDCSAVAGQER